MIRALRLETVHEHRCYQFQERPGCWVGTYYVSIRTYRGLCYFPNAVREPLENL